MDALTSPPRKNKRARMIGGVIAISAMLALGALAWCLTNQPREWPRRSARCRWRPALAKDRNCAVRWAWPSLAA